MSPLYPLLGLVAALRLAELALAKRNTARLLARGGVEIGRSHYPALVLLHTAWLVTIAVVIPPDRQANPLFLGLFGLLLAARFWVICSLGPYWTTRIITIPGEKLVRRGPYNFMRHPNYAVVVGEIAVLPLIFGTWKIALLFSILNALLLAWRIRIEDGALESRRTLTS